MNIAKLIKKKNKSSLNKKGMTEWELVGIIIGLIVLGFILYQIFNASSQSCGLISNIFGKC